MRIVRAHIVAIIVIGVLGAPAAAQDLANDSAAVRSIASAFLAAVDAHDWKAAAGFLDVTPLEREREMQARNARSNMLRSQITVEDIMSRDSTMPRAAAEYQLAQIRKQMGQRRNYLDLEFADMTDPDSLLTLPIERVAERWLLAQTEDYRLLRALRASPGCAAVADSLMAQRPDSRHAILGVIVRDSIAYVAFDRRASAPTPDLGFYSEPPPMLTLHRVGATWWILPRNQFLRRGSAGIAVSCHTSR